MSEIEQPELEERKYFEEMEKSLGKEIYRKAVDYLKEENFPPPIPTMKDQIIYFGAPDENTIYQVIGGGGEPGDIVDKVAHQIHELVEISKIKEKIPLVSLNECLEKYPEVQEKAHQIAKSWEEKFLEKVNKEKLKEEFKNFAEFLKEEKRRDEKLEKEIEEKVKKMKENL